MIGKHRIMTNALRALGMCVCAVVVASCASSDPAEEKLLVCPRVGVLEDASRMVTFRPGEGRTLDDVAYDTEITNATISCRYDKGRVRSDIAFDMDMWAGRAAPLGTAQFRYFVAVTELNTTVITKQYFTVEADFTKKSRDYKSQDVEDIYLDYSKLGRPDLYEILVGWDLSPEQLQYNRSTDAFDRPDITKFQYPNQ